jgi:hypothetical protein
MLPSCIKEKSNKGFKLCRARFFFHQESK